MPNETFALDFRQLFENLPGLYIIVLPDMTVAAVSEEYLKATMLRREDIVGRNLFEVFPENPDEDAATHSMANVRGSLERVFQTGDVDTLPIQKYDIQRPAEQGGGYEERFWSLKTFPVFADEEKKVRYAVHYVEDITELVRLEQNRRQQDEASALLLQRNKRMEAEIYLRAQELQATNVRLHESERRFRSVVEQSPLSMMIFNKDGRPLTVNRSFRELWNVSLDEISEQNIFEIEEFQTPERAEMIERLLGGEAVVLPAALYSPVPHIKPEAAPRWLESHLYPVKDGNDQASEFVLKQIDLTRRREMELALEDTRLRLEAALEAGAIGTWTWDVRHNRVVADKNLALFFSVSPEDAQGGRIESYVAAIHEEDVDRVKTLIADALENKDSYEAEYRLVKPDGGVRWVFARGSIVRDETGAAVSLPGVVIDITSRKETEEALRETLERFGLISRATNDTIWDWNLQTNLVRWNESVETMFGYAKEDVETTAKWWYEHIHAEDRDRVVKSIHDVIDNGGEKWSDEYRFICADGSFRYVLDRGFAIHRDGKPIRMLGAMQDVTARRTTEAALQKSQERLQLVLDSSVLGLWYCDLPFDVLNWSTQTKEHFWLSPDAAVTIEDFYRIIHPADRELTRSAIDASIVGQTHYDVVYRTVSPDGDRVKWIRATGRGFYDENGDPYRFDGITIDITEERMIQSERERLLWNEKEARAEAENANRLKDEFLATLSHELRTPLSSILGWSRLLKEKQIDGEQAERAVEIIERNAKSQSQLIEDILDVSRIISGKLRLDINPVELAPVIELAIESVRPAAEAKSIRLQKVLTSGVMISGDADRLQQIIWNLLSNAIKFTPKQGRVMIKLERVNSHVEITIADNGQGIETETLPFIFERFRQSDSSTTRQYGGLGLGLAIVRHLVELHGGTVQAASEGIGQGAVFTVSFPIIPVRSKEVPLLDEPAGERVSPTAQSSVPFVCPPEIRNLRVLVVDDERDTRELLVFIFEHCEARITGVSSVNEALEKIESEEFDVLVSDIGMPERDGYDLIQAVRELPPEKGGRIPAVALTAYARVEDRMRVLSAGFQMHVPKPVEPAELLAVVASLAGWNNRR